MANILNQATNSLTTQNILNVAHGIGMLKEQISDYKSVHGSYFVPHLSRFVDGLANNIVAIEQMANEENKIFMKIDEKLSGLNIKIVEFLGDNKENLRPQVSKFITGLFTEICDIRYAHTPREREEPPSDTKLSEKEEEIARELAGLLIGLGALKVQGSGLKCPCFICQAKRNRNIQSHFE